MTGNTLDWSVDEWLAYLEAIHPVEIELGLARVSSVAEKLGCLRPAGRVILVGGTNGKGTTSALLAALLRAQGMSVGIYNSPHIHRYNERVTLDGEFISDSDLCRSFQAVEDARGDTSLTYFEFGTLAALWHFSQTAPDAVVLEIGLGGRLDAVNIVEADLSVVTSIGLDHQAWLGDTTEQIAYEKCSIARQGRWLVCGQQTPPATAAETVSAIGGLWCCRDSDFTADLRDEGLEVSYRVSGVDKTLKFPEYSIPHHNVATAVQALGLMGWLPQDDVIVQTVAALRVPGRWQVVRQNERTYVLDVAHNPQAAAYLRHHVDRVDCLVLGMLSDKDVAGVIEALPEPDRIITVTLDTWRGLSADALAERIELTGRVVADRFDNMEDALTAVPEEGVILIAGSFYTVEAAGELITAREGTWNSI